MKRPAPAFAVCLAAALAVSALLLAVPSTAGKQDQTTTTTTTTAAATTTTLPTTAADYLGAVYAAEVAVIDLAAARAAEAEAQAVYEAAKQAVRDALEEHKTTTLRRRALAAAWPEGQELPPPTPSLPPGVVEVAPLEELLFEWELAGCLAWLGPIHLDHEAVLFPHFGSTCYGKWWQYLLHLHALAEADLGLGSEES